MTVLFTALVLINAAWAQSPDDCKYLSALYYLSTILHADALYLSPPDYNRLSL